MNIQTEQAENTYEMHVYCRRNGVTRDGGLHATEKGKSVDEVQSKFDREGSWLLKFYDEISVTITENGKAVRRYKLRRRA